jgi:hypothetical protein
MYPTVVKDRASLEACFDRLYEDYVRSVKRAGASDDYIIPKDEWLEMLRLLPREMLAIIVCNFNQKELEVLSN